MKILNTFSVENNNDKITVEVVETEKGIGVLINGKTMDVSVNEQLIYSKYDKEEYKYIIPSLRDFVSKYICTWGDGIEIKEDNVLCDLLINGVECWINMPHNRASRDTVSIYNSLFSYEKIKDELSDPKMLNGEKILTELINSINEIGYDFKFAWGGDEYDDTYGLVIPINDFNEEKILKCMNLWEDYNNKLSNLFLFKN